MKKILLTTLALGVLTFTSHGQGTVNFVNNGSTLFQYIPLNSATLTPVSVPVGGGRVELLWAPLGTTDLGLFQVLGATVTVNPAAGRFVGGTRTIPAGSGYFGIAPGDTVSMVVRGWQGPATSWAQAIFDYNNMPGYSEIFTINTGDPTTTPAGVPTSLTTPGGFTGLIVSVPEPSTLALCGFGLAPLFAIRRRRSIE